MKEQLVVQQPDRCHEHDNRQLVNLDFYENEISIMHHRLDAVLADHKTKKIKTRVDYLDRELSLQRLNLEGFRKNYDAKEMSYGSKLNLKREKMKSEAETNHINHDQSFFEHLQSFERTFKVVRQEVLEFINIPV
jgi:hypothetical protein